jgi:hypothetical protein
MSLNLKIALIGNKRVGKDTFYDIIKENQNYNIKHYTIAKPLKDIVKLLFNFTEEQLYGNEKEIVDINWNIKPRDVLQKFGTEIMQFDIHKYFPNINLKNRTFWVQKIFSILNNIDNPNEISLITDVRHPHEVDVLKNLKNIYFIKINRNTGIIDNHITENEINNIPKELISFEINNNGTLEDYKKKINDLFNSLVH